MSKIKFVACQAHCINQYKNLRIKVSKFCTSIYFKWRCLEQGIIPKYANIKIPYTSPASTIIQKKIQITRVKDESLLLSTIKSDVFDVLFNFFAITVTHQDV